MNLKKYFFLLLLLLGCKGFSQISNQLGVIAGPIAFQTDYGENKDYENIERNVGYSFGIVHYINFAFDASCNCFNRYKYFNDHFMVRNELSYYFSKLNHYGRYVDPSHTSLAADQLRAMEGDVSSVNLGTQLEFYPISMREYISGTYLFVPYGGLGIHANFLHSTNYSDMGDITDPTVMPEKFYGSNIKGVQNATVFSFVANIGLKFKLTRHSDILIDARYQTYISDWVEGLNPDSNLYPENEHNDAAISMSLGYILYL